AGQPEIASTVSGPEALSTEKANPMLTLTEIAAAITKAETVIETAVAAVGAAVTAVGNIVTAVKTLVAYVPTLMTTFENAYAA
ncbi:hypothetical protein, partial [Bacillus sp. SIMBA_033]